MNTDNICSVWLEKLNDRTIFEKELAARKIEAIPGLMEFDIPVRGDNRGWFKENFKRENASSWFSRKFLCGRQVAK